MRLTRAEKEQLESVGIQCIQISEDSPTERSLEESVQKFNEVSLVLDEAFQALVRDLSYLNTLYNQSIRSMRSKAMFGMKSDCSISRYEEDYLISKGWDERIFKD